MSGGEGRQGRRQARSCPSKRCASGGPGEDASPEVRLGVSGGSSLLDADDGNRPRPARSSIKRSRAAKKVINARSWTVSLLSGTDVGCGANFTGPDAIQQIAAGLLKISAPQPQQAPEKRNIVQVHIGALSSLARVQLRLIELPAGLGRSP